MQRGGATSRAIRDVLPRARHGRPAPTPASSRRSSSCAFTGDGVHAGLRTSSTCRGRSTRRGHRLWTRCRSMMTAGRHRLLPRRCSTSPAVPSRGRADLRLPAGTRRAAVPGPLLQGFLGWWSGTRWPCGVQPHPPARRGPRRTFAAPEVDRIREGCAVGRRCGPGPHTLRLRHPRRGGARPAPTRRRTWSSLPTSVWCALRQALTEMGQMLPAVLPRRPGGPGRDRRPTCRPLVAHRHASPASRT